MSFVSVIIPTYNRADLLPKAIKSVLRQTHPHIEINIIDDGSSDNTKDVLKSYGGRVKYFCSSHSGLPAIARNVGLSNAQGEYIAFLDSDDEWLPEKLEKQLTAMRFNNCQASCTNAWRIRDGEINSAYFDFRVPKLLTFNDLLSTNYVICSSAIVHRSILSASGNFPESANFKAIEDYALWLRVTNQTNWAYLPEPLTIYTDIPAQSIRRESISVFEQKRRVFTDFLNWSKKTNSPQSFRWKTRVSLIANSIKEARHTISGYIFGKNV